MRTARSILAVGFLALAVSGVRAEDAPKAAAAAWEYPREVLAAGRRTFLHEPQVLSRDAAKDSVKLRFPVQVLDAAGRIFWGMTEATGTTHFDLASRLVLVDGITAGDAAMPQLGEKERADVLAALPAAMPKELTLRLELVTAAAGAPPADGGIKAATTAPEIFVRRTPAVLVQIDGEPVKDLVAEFPIEYVVNTAADLFRDPKSDTWYLLADGSWLEAKSLQGPWKAAAQMPILLTQIPITHPRGHVRMFMPGTQESAARGVPKKGAAAAPVPEVIVREKPAELVLLKGDPLLTMVPGVKLLAVANTESDMLFHPKTESFYLCVSGRWFTAEDVSGPWKEAFGALPPELSKIPRDHALGHLAWCIPGTPEAAEAVALTSIEERATISRATSVTVSYEGKEPRVVPLEGSNVKFATNTDDDVFSADGAFWCCAKGLWFRSDDGRANWSPAPSVPLTLSSVTESCGLFQTKFVRAAGPAEQGFRFAVSGGFQGVFVSKGAPVHGTGAVRRGVLRDGNWFPYPRTWGENRWYDPVAGVFQARSVRYGADMKAAADEWSPYTASYGRVRQFADRYGQGGRRMFPFTADSGRFDLSAGRPDPFGPWGTQVKERDGLDAKRFPLGDRSAETSPKEPAVVADAKGVVWRAGAKSAETWNGKDWAAGEGFGDAERAALETLVRIRSRPDQLRAWAEKRRAALPVNPTITR